MFIQTAESNSGPPSHAPSLAASNLTIKGFIVTTAAEKSALSSAFGSTKLIYLQSGVS
jgi:hypothetical protein